jgi:hypothetical protein
VSGGAGIAIGITFVYAEIKDIQGQLFFKGQKLVEHNDARIPPVSTSPRNIWLSRYASSSRRSAIWSKRAPRGGERWAFGIASRFRSFDRRFA